MRAWKVYVFCELPLPVNESLPVATTSMLARPLSSEPRLSELVPGPLDVTELSRLLTLLTVLLAVRLSEISILIVSPIACGLRWSENNDTLLRLGREKPPGGG